MNRIRKIVTIFILCFTLGAVAFGSAEYRLTAYAYTDEEKAAVKAWLSAHGYPPTMAGAEQAYQDYLNGLIGSEEPPAGNVTTEPPGTELENENDTNPENVENSVDIDNSAEVNSAESMDDSEKEKAAEEAKVQKEAEEKKAAEEAKAQKEAEEKKAAEEAKAQKEAEEKKAAEEEKAKKEAEDKKAAEEAKKAEEEQKRAEEAREEAEQKALQEAENKSVKDSFASENEDINVEEQPSNMFLLWLLLPVGAVIACLVFYVRRKNITAN